MSEPITVTVPTVAGVMGAIDKRIDEIFVVRETVEEIFDSNEPGYIPPEDRRQGMVVWVVSMNMAFRFRVDGAEMGNIGSENPVMLPAYW